MIRRQKSRSMSRMMLPMGAETLATRALLAKRTGSRMNSLSSPSTPAMTTRLSFAASAASRRCRLLSDKALPRQASGSG